MTQKIGIALLIATLALSSAGCFLAAKPLYDMITQEDASKKQTEAQSQEQTKKKNEATNH